MIEFYEDIIRKTIECYDTVKQSVVCMEECCELVQAISKELRGKSDKEHLAEEMADILICMEMLKIMYHVTDDELNEWVKKKQFRHLKRITESGVGTGYVAGYEQAFEDLDKAILDNEVCNQNMNGDCYEEIMKIMRKLREEIKNDRE
jgi:NTP pyrophosphatase (non-canonical NTP hydrolase)